jgi:hypothetical protein
MYLPAPLLSLVMSLERFELQDLAFLPCVLVNHLISFILMDSCNDLHHRSSIDHDRSSIFIIDLLHQQGYCCGEKYKKLLFLLLPVQLWTYARSVSSGQTFLTTWCRDPS